MGIGPHASLGDTGRCSHRSRAVFGPGEMWLDDDGADPRGHVVSVHGELVGRDARVLSNAVEDVLDHGAPTVIVDLTDSSFLDSTGVAALIACWRAVTSQRTGAIAEGAGRERMGLVVPLDAHTRRLLQTRGVDRLFSVAPSRDQTFSSLGLSA